MEKSKEALRYEMRKMRRLVDNNTRQAHAAATAKLILDKFPDCTAWLLYKACHTVAQTDILEQSLRKNGIMPAFPRVTDTDIEFCPVPNPDTDWSAGRFSIPEPAQHIPCITRFEPGTIVVVPGLAFAPDGSRLGYGGGYYDRFLQHFPGISIGIFFPVQYVHNIMTFAHDQPVQYLCDGENLFAAKEFPRRV